MGLIHRLVEKGVTLLFLVPDTAGLYHQLREEGHTAYCIPFKLSIWPNSRTRADRWTYWPKTICRTVINIWAIYRMMRLMKQLQPDVVHTNTSVVSLGRIAAKWAGITHVQHIREYGEYGDQRFSMHYFPSWKHVHRAMRRDNACNICITRDIQRHHGLDTCGNAQVVYDGVHDTVSRLPRHGKEPFFLYAGRIEHVKGLDLLLQAYSGYKQKVRDALRLYVAGDASDSLYLKEIQVYIAAHHLEADISFLGNVGHLGQLMQKATALIIPSRSEGFGFCMPEAMFNGCLCIGYDTAGTKEQMDNGRELTGGEIALRYSTVEELTERLLEVHATSSGQWDAMRERAFTTVNTLYTHATSANTIFDIYKTLTSHKRERTNL